MSICVCIYAGVCVIVCVFESGVCAHMRACCAVLLIHVPGQDDIPDGLRVW